jgi:hypothetical protein
MMPFRMFITYSGEAQSNADQAGSQGIFGFHFGLVFSKLALLHLFWLLLLLLLMIPFTVFSSASPRTHGYPVFRVLLTLTFLESFLFLCCCFILLILFF